MLIIKIYDTNTYKTQETDDYVSYKITLAVNTTLNKQNFGMC